MSDRRIVVLAGGVGAARFLTGLVQVAAPSEITVIVNTGDDRDFFGLRVCPDLDILTYTLAGRIRADTGWGLEGDTFTCLQELRRFRDDTWFQLGDRDLATHLHRSERLRQGATLSAVTREITLAFGLEIELLPMSDDPAPTMLVRSGGKRCDFEEYLVRDGAPDDIREVDLSAARSARPAPGVLEAIAGAERLLVCPSNPVVSIGTIRAVSGVEEQLRARGDAVAVSPLIGRAPVKGPADRLLPAFGVEVSSTGVAELYLPIAAGMLIDEADRDEAAGIEALGLRVRTAESLMRTPEVAAELARTALELAAEGAEA